MEDGAYMLIDVLVDGKSEFMVGTGGHDEIGRLVGLG